MSRIYRDETPTDLWGFTLPASFVRRVDAPTPDGCWNWTGFCRKGYGRYVHEKRTENAHRVSFLLCVGDLDPGLVIDHLCRNHSCVNPAHLEQVTSRVNTLRGNTIAARNAAKVDCIHGHPLTGFSSGRRYCRTCNDPQVACECGRTMRRTSLKKHQARYCTLRSAA